MLFVYGILFPLARSREPVPIDLTMVCSREPVPFAWICSRDVHALCMSFVLLVSSLYCKFALLFLIYTILTFDNKKKRLRSDSKNLKEVQ
jgi:hypothetical protein